MIEEPLPTMRINKFEIGVPIKINSKPTTAAIEFVRLKLAIKNTIVMISKQEKNY
ncbi:hypothetical protein LOT_1515 [Lentilactobacillus otakiensis DSM 19908 = JCM 15040]|uniref:Uncharacterized protein n=1 Tax=Lentilactobacillus otakiensis DSM 19908 = JCM 15040 TaxID=1423780 RepID=S4NIC1_9LACO|nr:hypothetical protein LOT_1515 [Lentilactobacillus otakiensis DSM 19908 = JCM 15040]